MPISGSISEARLADLVTAHPDAARVLERFGLDFCCGGAATLAAACDERGIDPAEVEAALNEVGEPNPADWSTMGVGELVDHLEATHHAFLRVELDHLVPTVQHLQERDLRNFQLLPNASGSRSPRHEPQRTDSSGGAIGDRVQRAARNLRAEPESIRREQPRRPNPRPRRHLAQQHLRRRPPHTERGATPAPVQAMTNPPQLAHFNKLPQ